MTHINKTLFLIYCIIISEIKSIVSKFEYFLYFIRNIDLFKYIFFIFNKNKIIPFKSKAFENYIKENRSKWKNLEHKIDSKEKILIENFINQAAYGMSNAIIGKYLSKINNNNIIGFIRDGDIKSEVIFRSFGIKNFIFFKKKKFFFEN